VSELLKRVPVISPSIPSQLWMVFMEAVCKRYGHNWRPYGKPLRFGHREYCVRCLRQAVELADGRVECSKADVMAADPDLAEALYQARWGELPRQRLTRGEWPVAD
jgi:hypothetical protein